VRIGIFGGTFDPPHVGHLILAGEAASQLKLARLLWVLTPDPPHKLNKVVPPAEQRLELVKAEIEGEPAFELSRVDLDRRGPHYAVDTLQLLAAAYPDDELVYLMGGDSLRDLPTWYRPHALLEACAMLGVMRRPQDQIDLAVLEQALPGITAKVAFIDTPLVEISSADIRRRMATGQPYRYFLTERVYQIIRAKNYYAPVDS
jgi:nicotinate-nucleotide adenylyltransferase